ncbi:hypothetical protein FN846DRAFT_996545 [Sphaerosporella brunnea]|uniref:Uncharacterized protein n=1 Tax=Sphaerosporella brunnea TaxID=1250544 RepID=A0A5J5F5V0_9PEZI|nr:hypothetical protein FN846DRAFT_996545 [Sphaerosporella brunnea]
MALKLPLDCNRDCVKPTKLLTLQTPPQTRTDRPSSYPSPPRVTDDIARFLRAPPIAERDLVLTVAHSAYLSPALTGLLAACDRQHRRWSFNPYIAGKPGFGTLRICSMVRSVHNSLGKHISDLFRAMNRAPFLEDAEAEVLDIFAREVKLPSIRYQRSEKCCKWPAWAKTPDAGFYVQQGSDDSLPRVVCEIGFSESYDDLLDDAYQWLLKAPDVQLVILVKVDEDSKTLAARQKSRQNEIEQLVWQFGNRLARSKLKTRPDLRRKRKADDSNSDSDTALYRTIADNISYSDWVGPLTAYLEFWRLKDGVPMLDGSRISLLPELTTDANPVIKITDLLPESMIVGDAVREWPFDVSRYHNTLKNLTLQVARDRAVEHCRPRGPRGQEQDDYSFADTTDEEDDISTSEQEGSDSCPDDQQDDAASAPTSEHTDVADENPLPRKNKRRKHAVREQ